MASSNLQIVLASRPKGELIPSEVFTTKTIPSASAADLTDGQILVETLYLSLDPVMRKWLDPASYLFDIQLGDAMPGPVLARVLASRSPTASPGDLVTAWSGWVTTAVVDADKFEVYVAPPGAKATDALGFLGFTGLTAYHGMLTVAKPTAGETVVVSAAAGATGSVAAQLAKIKGARVVGIAGSKEKVEWLKKLGVDEVVDYKEDGFEDKFVEAVKGGIDVYFDNVGGRILELAMDNMKDFGRILICGDVSGYNTDKPRGIKASLFLTYPIPFP
ncbi:hypothetical protein G7046_g4902 [Stylonectria norvegica]|nr:hypothetical protein G7046_g4902 [Stylonectria norvegica]